MKTQKINITQDEEQSIATEVIATEIRAISAGIKRLRKSPLNERALILLITQATPRVGKGYRAKNVSARVVEAVLRALENLEIQYLK